MNVASFFSGGKDSTFAIFLAQKLGYEIKCLITLFPYSDDSHLLHHPNAQWTKIQAESMKIPQVIGTTNTADTENEIQELEKLLLCAKHDFGIEGLVHGGIASNFQKNKFEQLCKKHDLQIIAPLWGCEPFKYMNDLIENNFEFIIISISSGGLDEMWLGKKITKDDISKLHVLSKKHGFNLNFEGGEAETFVINCPLFSKPITIYESRKFWDGYRGRFEIVDAGVNYNA